MSRTITVAAVQMVAGPAPKERRLARAERLIAQAAREGAQLVVLPELFNTGYEYSDDNYLRAEPAGGPTVTWMLETSDQHGVHLAGSFLLLDHGDIYNTLWLVAPDGCTWRYDKNYPWVWERAYFRGGHGITVAATSLGRFGMMICWDAAHPKLWARYAARVDAMLVSSCPPAAHDMTLHLPDGTHLRSEEAGPIMQHIKRTSGETFGRYLRRQAAHLGVPVINTTGAGTFSSAVPLPKLSLLIYTMGRPDLWKYIPKVDSVLVETGYFNETYIADAAGRVLRQVPPEEEGYVLVDVRLVDSPPQPVGKQPGYGLSSWAYLVDAIANVLLSPVYRRGVRRAYGRHTARVSHQTKKWVIAIIAGLVLAALLAWAGRHRKR